jgi:restriction system protein
MGLFELLFGTPQNRQEVSVESLKQQSQEALNEYRTKAGEIASPHFDTLAKKKKRLIRVDDYGVVCRDKWDVELQYFCERVLLTNQDMIGLETKVLEVDNRLVYQSKYTISPQGPREALYEYIDAIVDMRLEGFAEELPDYSDDITPEDYEYFVAGILNDAGWVAVVTQASGDQGIDVVAEKNNFRLAIQCKKYSKPVGNKAVQEAYSGAAFYEADACAVVAPIEYTPAAIELAGSLGVHLFHHDDLVGLSIEANEA